LGVWGGGFFVFFFFFFFLIKKKKKKKNTSLSKGSFYIKTISNLNKVKQRRLPQTN
jgi:hypothetical protein